MPYVPNNRRLGSDFFGPIDASDVTFTPLALPDWLAGDPGNVDDALDELSQRAKTAEDHAANTSNPHSLELDDLTDVNVASPSDGDVLEYTGGSINEWQSGISLELVAGTGIGITYNSVAGTLTIDANLSLDDLTNVDASIATDGQILAYIGGSVDAWQAVNPSVIGGYTTADFLTDFSTQDTDDLIQGSTNFYWSQSLFDIAFALKNLDDLLDVNAVTPSDGQVLTYVGGSINEWQAQNTAETGITSLGGETGATQTLTPVDNTNIDFVITSSSDDHSFEAVWSADIDDLTDVNVPNPSDGQVLTYVGGSVDQWRSITLPIDDPGIISLHGLTAATQTFGNNTIDANITLSMNSGGSAHTWKVAWTGQASVSRGGTGRSTLTDGAVLIGNGIGGITSEPMSAGQILIGFGGITDPIAAFITEGTGISITSAAGSITIAADIVELLDSLGAADDGNVLTYIGGSTGYSWEAPTGGGSGITSLGGETGATQTLTPVDNTNIDFVITSSSDDHSFEAVWSADIDDLTDVNVPAPSDGQVLTYVGGSINEWQSSSSSGVPTGSSFPGTPSDGDYLHYIPDDELYYYDDGRASWLSAAKESVDMGLLQSTWTINVFQYLQSAGSVPLDGNAQFDGIPVGYDAKIVGICATFAGGFVCSGEIEIEDTGLQIGSTLTFTNTVDFADNTLDIEVSATSHINVKIRYTGLSPCDNPIVRLILRREGDRAGGGGA